LKRAAKPKQTMVKGCTQANKVSYFDAKVFYQIPNFPDTVWKIGTAFLVAYQRYFKTWSTKRKQNKSLSKHLQCGREKNEIFKNQLVI
jgi:hypothetical protein